MPFHDLAACHARYAPAIERRLAAVFAHGRFILGPEVAELEAALARFVGVPHAVSVKSGTLALELGLRALGVGPGDEVITSPFSWVSAAEAIALVGARPVFVDIEPEGFLLDAEKLERAITSRTRAIVPVSLFGQLPELEHINALAAQHGLSVIEDGAQSFGARRHGARSSSLTTLGVTSFFPTKPLGCYGDGGALFTRDAALADKLRALRGHGAVRPGEHSLVGVNGRLDTVQAAVLLAKLPELEADLRERRRLAQNYDAALGGVARTPRVLAGGEHVFGQYTLRVAERERVVGRLTELGIPTAVHYRKCLHQQPVFAHCAPVGSLPEAERAAREVLSLPLYPGLGAAEQQRVIEACLLACS